ncbi:MAG: hypothetical protein VR66_16065 [Peptococcaceae bacterium BRH_c23]|nr:MAG: hypothetical protein VR66_16065 [Peptococcaceae bacterium BRH_c23]KJS85849.1 MAG: hypothetical protein JL57_17715 [Desulfosporosinus sp. BICA1-9]KJS89172.1 MAG: hypothetical protein JL57_08705 [Desulfosporosinus sp. BICA1-9]HBW37095.1 hypothetical protein [Desulfosporosinus sp.]
MKDLAFKEGKTRYSAKKKGASYIKNGDTAILLVENLTTYHEVIQHPVLLPPTILVIEEGVVIYDTLEGKTNWKWQQIIMAIQHWIAIIIC